jgi:hypothetical protein
MNEQQMIKNKYNQIQKKLKGIQSELDWLQKTCKHPTADAKHKADRGNYDPSMDRYWIEYSCPDCGKFWTEDR